MNILNFSNVSLFKSNKFILNNINVSVKHKDFVSIVGHSGSGKSTFLKLCNNLINPTNGTITYKEKDIFSYNPISLRKEIAYCFQSPYLFPSKVIDNLEFPYKIKHKKVDNDRIISLLNLFQIDTSILNKNILSLSGGEKQRISLIRTLLFPPKILLLDEVTSALDSKNTLLVEKIIDKLNKNGLTILWVTHNNTQSTKYANKLLTFSNGKIESLEVLR